ncbi:hypothetical protein BH688_07550 [Kushneria phosphatilytica]|nr:hypothetical protein BH688_07550 [Kushneria phosphatilytica]
MNAIEQSRAYGAPGDHRHLSCQQWRQKYVFDRYPHYAERLAEGFLAIARRDGNAAGNRWLRKTCKQLHVGPFRVTHDDEGIRNHAEAQSLAIKRSHDELIAKATRSGGSELDAAEEALRLGLERVEIHEIDPPDNKSTIRAQLARLEDAKWWRRKLRVLAGRRLEQLEREIGNVHRRAGIYCSNTTVERRKGAESTQSCPAGGHRGDQPARPVLHAGRTLRIGAGKPGSPPCRADAPHSRDRNRGAPAGSHRRVLYPHLPVAVSPGAGQELHA